MAAAHRRYGRRGHVTLDWALVAVALMAVAVLIGTAIRTGAPGAPSQFGAQVGGLRALSETETLLVFEDMANGVAGWSGGSHDAAHPGLGAVWFADPSGEALSRTISLPEGTVRAVVSFDLVAIDDWNLQGLSVAVDGTEVLRQRFTSRADQQIAAAEPVTRTDRIVTRAHLAAPRELGFASGTPAMAEQILRVSLAVFTTDPTLTLTISPLASEAETEMPLPHWAIDNLIVTAERLP